TSTRTAPEHSHTCRCAARARRTREARALPSHMNPLKLSQIAQLAGASLSSGDGSVVINKVSTDSRTIKPGELFVALRGENFEGHDFIEAAAKAGAAGALVDFVRADKVPNNFAILRTTDTLKAYQTLAANYRRSLTLKVLAITGSN